MTDYDTHDVSYSSTTKGSWSSPAEHDFDTDDLSKVDDHYLVSSSGFAPDNFGDLKLPVVDPDGNLNLNALESAHGGAHSVESVDDMDDSTQQQVKNKLESLSQSEFDHQIDGGSG